MASLSPAMSLPPDAADDGDTVGLCLPCQPVKVCLATALESVASLAPSERQQLKDRGSASELQAIPENATLGSPSGSEPSTTTPHLALSPGGPASISPAHGADHWTAQFDLSDVVVLDRLTSEQTRMMELCHSVCSVLLLEQLRELLNTMPLCYALCLMIKQKGPNYAVLSVYDQRYVSKFIHCLPQLLRWLRSLDQKLKRKAQKKASKARGSKR